MRLVTVSLLFGLLVGALVGLAFGWPSLRISYGIIPAILAAGGAAYFIYRRVSERLAAEMLVVQNILAASPQRPATSVAEQREMEAKARTTIDQAVVVLLSVRDRLGPWIPTMTGQISGNIGSLFYMSKRFDDARPYLAAAAFNHGLAHAMLGAIHFRDKAPLLMKAAFERAVKWSEKEALILRLLHQHPDLYGLKLVEAAQGHLKRGTAYVTLRRMEEKTYLSSRPEPRSPPSEPPRLWRVAWP
jgi:hypothetical protein